jgi:hypothetical protein
METKKDLRGWFDVREYEDTSTLFGYANIMFVEGVLEKHFKRVEYGYNVCPPQREFMGSIPRTLIPKHIQLMVSPTIQRTFLNPFPDRIYVETVDVGYFSYKHVIIEAKKYQLGHKRPWAVHKPLKWDDPTMRQEWEWTMSAVWEELDKLKIKYLFAIVEHRPTCNWHVAPYVEYHVWGSTES